MTDDEAFVRAVVERPGDDTPRLVYADWLDDHDHPARAAYLRAEVEAVRAVRAGRAAELREMAAGLDAEWVARVSRPPYGLCLDRLRFLGFRSPPSAAGLADVERGINDMVFQRWGLLVVFPEQYRLFLRWYNGGTPRPDLLTVPDGQGGTARVEVERFCSAKSPSYPQDDFAWMWPYNFCGRYLPIAYTVDRGLLFLGLSDHDRGHAFFARDPHEQPIELAPDLPGLLALLHD